MRVYYPAEVSRDPDTDYGVSFPDFPGCVTTGPDIAAALRNAEQALGGHIEAMLADGEPIPEPTPPAAVCSPPADNVIAVAMVPGLLRVECGSAGPDPVSVDEPDEAD